MTDGPSLQRPPRDDQEWARSVQQRLHGLTSQQTTRVGEWVLASRDGKLIAVRPGQTALEVGQEPTPEVVDLGARGDFVTSEELDTAIDTNNPVVLQQIRDALTGIVDATPTDLDNWLLNLLTSTSPLDASNLFGTLLASLIPGLDASKIVSGTFGDGLVPIVGVLRDAIGQAIDGGSTTGYTAAQVKSKLQAFPGGNIVGSLAAALISGVLSGSNIPALDASKVTTGTFGTGLIPGLDAAKIISGALALARIPSLPAGQITSGVFGAGLIPGLDASKITSGSFAQSMITGLVTDLAAKALGSDLATLLNNLFDGSSGTTGSTGKTAGQVLAALQALFDSGGLKAAKVPALDASKITSGSFSQSRVTDLVPDLAAKLPTNLWTARAQRGNLMLGGDFEDTTILRGIWASGDYSTEEARSGTTSWKMGGVADESDLCLYPIPSDIAYDTDSALRVQPGERYYVEAWAKGKGTNVGGAGEAGMWSLFRNAATDEGTWDYGFSDGVDWVANDPGGTAWTKLYGWVTVPDGMDRWMPYIYTSPSMPTTDYFYIADVLIREETASQSIIQQLFGGSTVGSEIQESTVPGIGLIRDGLVNKLTGLVGSGWGQADADQAVADTQATLAAAVAAIQAMQTQNTNNGFNGNSAIIDFSTRANASSMGADFTQTYSGAGSTTTGITNGAVTTQPVVGSPRTCIYVYNALQFTTDYQKVGQVFSSAPNIQFAGNNASNTITARSNSAGTSYVFVELEKNTARLGCVVSGSRTVWTTLGVGGSGSFSFKAGQVYWLVCGTAGGIRTYQVLEGSTPIISWTEVGTASQMGASYRHPGGGTYVYSAGAAVITAGSFVAFAFADNTPATVLGNGFKVYNSSTSNVSITGGSGRFPNNFFNATDKMSNGIGYAAGSNNAITINKTGWWIFTIRAFSSDSLGTGSDYGVDLYLSTSIKVRGGRVMGSITGDEAMPQYTFIEYFTAGDVVSPGYDFKTTKNWKGDAGGTQSYFSGTYIGNAA